MKRKILTLIAMTLSFSCFAQEDPGFSSTIAVVDMRDFDNPDTRDQVIETVRGAMHEHGFFAVTNTSINSTVINESFSAATEYFALSEDAKMKHYAPQTDGQRGYIPFGSEKAKGMKAIDFKEFYHLGREWTDEQLERLNYPTNIWPEDTLFTEKMKIYISHLEVYMQKLQKIIALAMGCEDTFFDSITGEGEGLLRVIHYPAMEKNFVDEDAIWAGAHTDINMFTILPEATAEGLEVQLSDGTWMPVFAQKDSMIVNCGDMTEAYSNGYFKSSVHRVKAPKGRSGSERYSMVFFCHGKKDDLVYPLKHCVEMTGGVEKFAHATVGELKSERFTENNQASDELVNFLAESGVMDRLVDVKRASYEPMCVLRDRGLATEKVLNYLAEVEAARSYIETSSENSE